MRHFVYDKEWEAYCNEMGKDGSWGTTKATEQQPNFCTGDHLTLIAAAEVFNARIVIVSSVPGDSFIVQINPICSEEQQPDGTVRIIPPMHLLTLSHFAEFHYGSVHPIDAANVPFQSI